MMLQIKEKLMSQKPSSLRCSELQFPQPPALKSLTSPTTSKLDKTNLAVL
jgi:hypothetical protein